MRTQSRLAVAAATALTTAALATATAGAEVTSVSVAAGPEGLVTGCAYTVTAVITDATVPPNSVFFMVAGGVIPGNGERLPGTPIHHPDSNTVTLSWTPTRQGAQNLVAVRSVPGEYTSTQYIPVEVRGAGLNTGSSCLPLP
ncbi:hypothetical protein ACTD5D_28270 [Nocardia takedensis]|uniref:hypothetical protein n=1 Tax=Nocardia takedensis TaxID=259390 RepID=UPI000308C1D9|nr:hypothetical protein [Nocardia takedensis]